MPIKNKGGKLIRKTELFGSRFSIENQLSQVQVMTKVKAQKCKLMHQKTATASDIHSKYLHM